MIVSAQDVSQWSDEVDVLVVGFGIAGACVAVEAAEAGARVLVLDRAGHGGSTTALAGGHFYQVAARPSNGRPGTTTRRSRCTATSSPSRRTRTWRRSARTATAARRTSTGWNGRGSSSSAATTRRRPSSSPVPRA